MTLLTLPQIRVLEALRRGEDVYIRATRGERRTINVLRRRGLLEGWSYLRITIAGRA